MCVLYLFLFIYLYMYVFVCLLFYQRLSYCAIFLGVIFVSFGFVRGFFFW
jgi:hypothetical protein